MKRKIFPAVMIGTACASCCLCICSAVLYQYLEARWLFSLAITFGTIFYHFAMRLLVGALIPNRFDPHRRWFQLCKAENILYKKLRIKHWKDHVPTYDPRLFSLQDNTLEGIVKNMCQAEVVHEVIIVCSFLPLLASLLWNDFWVFAITSLISALIDSVFVMMQRYNRPRLMRLLEKQRQGRKV